MYFIIGVISELSGRCLFKWQCPDGFYCSQKWGICVKKSYSLHYAAEVDAHTDAQAEVQESPEQITSAK